jgi:hypothetical protein
MQRNVYTALNVLTVGTNGINIIGVVTHLKEMAVTSSGVSWLPTWHAVVILTALCKDICRTVAMVDPSIFFANEEFSPVDGKGFKVNCFTAKYPEWLPSPKKNDVLIMRSIKVCLFTTIHDSRPIVASSSFSPALIITSKNLGLRIPRDLKWSWVQR